jgi:ATP-dependent RNA helicase HelY
VNGNVVVVATEPTSRGGTRAVALTDTSRIIKVGANELRDTPQLQGIVKLDKESWATLRARGGSRLDHALRRKMATALKSFEGNGAAGKPFPQEDDEDVELALARTAMLQHPCHSCPDRDRHAQWAERASRLIKETESLHRKVQSKTETLSRRFQRILGILEEYGYLDGFNLTDKGWSLARIYNENDLLITETIARGWLEDLEPAELAALLSVFVYESRGPVEVAGPLPSAATKSAYGKIFRLEERMKRSETRAGLEMIRGTETGFAMTAYRWCLGDPLEDVIDEDSSPGDFIRSTKQTIDLLRQVQQAAEDPELRRRLGQAVEAMNRGVVAYSGVSW